MGPHFSGLWSLLRCELNEDLGSVANWEIYNHFVPMIVLKTIERWLKPLSKNLPFQPGWFTALLILSIWMRAAGPIFKTGSLPTCFSEDLGSSFALVISCGFSWAGEIFFSRVLSHEWHCLDSRSILEECSVTYTLVRVGFPRGSDCKESACSAGDLGLIPRSGRSGEGTGSPLQDSWPGESHGQRSLVGCRVRHDWVTLTSLTSENAPSGSLFFGTPGSLWVSVTMRVVTTNVAYGTRHFFFFFFFQIFYFLILFYF